MLLIFFIQVPRARVLLAEVVDKGRVAESKGTNIVQQVKQQMQTTADLMEIELARWGWNTFNFPFNPLTFKLFDLNFHPPEVVSRWRDPQLQVSEN